MSILSINAYKLRAEDWKLLFLLHHELYELSTVIFHDDFLRPSEV